MQDKMIPIKGYFKVDRIVDGKVVDTYEDKNTVMAKIPHLYAGMAAGLYAQNLDKYKIGCIALGTGGLRVDSLGNEVPKEVRDNRLMLFSEFDFWNTPIQELENQPIVYNEKKHVYQTTFDVAPRGDSGQNMALADAISPQNQGPLFPANGGPAVNWISDPTIYRNESTPANNASGLTGTVRVEQNMVEYTFTLGTNAGNAEDDSARGYNEAALYFLLDADSKLDGEGNSMIGNPLGTLFSMKTFPSQWKNSSCALRINWKLYF